MAILTGTPLLAVCVMGVAVISPLSAFQAESILGEGASGPAQDQVLDEVRNYAGQYVANLPNFLCEQVTRQFEAGRRPTHWHKGDTLTSKLIYSEGHEQRTLELVNNKPVGRGTRPWRTPLITEGEFGLLLDNIFGSASNTAFTWKGWDTIAGRRVAIFDYSIDVEHSTLKLSLSDLAKALVPYHGSVYADPSTGAIWRITNTISDIPAEIQTKSVSTTVDYDEVAIGAKKYLLPVRAIVVMETDARNIRNEIEFSKYRKFEAESSITFASESAPASTESAKSTEPGGTPKK